MGTQVTRCGNCGSPDLDPFGEHVLKCRYCGKLNEVVSGRQTGGTAPPGCEIGGCGVQAIGRCHTCGHPFCASHQAILAGRRVVDGCSLCLATLMAERALNPPKPAANWDTEMARWWTTLSTLPEQPALRRQLLRSVPHGYEPGQLPGKRLVEVASAYGRPTWWVAEPQTGGLMIGWTRLPDFAVHIAADGTCDKTLARLMPNELDLSWTLRRLGNLIGKPMKVVEQWLGPPNSRSQGSGYVLLQWARPGYRIALKFGSDGGCRGIASQHSTRPVRA